MCVPSSRHGAQANVPSEIRAPVELTRASGIASHSLRACLASSRVPTSGSGGQRILVVDPADADGLEPAWIAPGPRALPRVEELVHLHRRSMMADAMVKVLRERQFRLLWLGQTASTIGDRLVFVALALYVTEIGTPTDVGIVLAAHAFPLVAFVLLGGVWADRLPRHKVMVATDLIRFSAHALLAALIFTGDGRDLAHRRDRGGASAPPRRSSARPTPA